MKVTDVAVIAPDAKQEIVGIRPGNCMSNDWREDPTLPLNTRALQDFAAINGWADDKAYKNGVKVTEGFVYASDSNLS